MIGFNVVSFDCLIVRLTKEGLSGTNTSMTHPKYVNSEPLIGSHLIPACCAKPPLADIGPPLCTSMRHQGKDA